MIKGLKFGFWTGLVTLLMLSATAAAANAAQVPSRSSTTAAPQAEPPRVFLSAAVNQGTSSLSNPTPNSTGTSGSRTELLLLATVELGDSFVIEGGGGWMRDRLSGTAQPTSASNPTQYEVVTDAGIAELSPRVRVLGGLEVGPLVELLYGADVSFAPGFGSGESIAWLGGGQALYGFKLQGASVRAGARYLQSLSLANHTLQSVQATLQIGLPVL